MEMWGEDIYLWEQKHKIRYARKEVILKVSNALKHKQSQRSTTACKHWSSGYQWSGIIKHFSLEVCFAEESVQKKLVRATACVPHASLNLMQWDKSLDKSCHNVHLYLVCLCFLQMGEYRYEKGKSLQSFNNWKYDSWFFCWPFQNWSCI